METICVMGLGYIGLPTASMFATHGYRVVGVDVQEAVVAAINRGEIHIREPGLSTIVQAAIRSRQLRASNKPDFADAFILAVPTPLRADKQPDLSHVEAATRSIAPFLRAGNLVVIESTLPPGTTAGLVASLLRDAGARLGDEVFLAHCPERVLPGHILEELIANDRIVGGIDRASSERAAQLYRSFVGGEIYLTDATTAETVKLVENAYRDVNIALANELALICEPLGLDVWRVLELANKHPRVHLHQPGPGVGGHCIAVDPWFLVSAFPEQARLLALARRNNDAMPQHVLGMIARLLPPVEMPKLALLGVAYKGNIDDTRGSPAIDVVEGLGRDTRFRERRLTLAIYDPHVQSFSCALSGLEDTLRGADLIVILADHNEFHYLEPEAVGALVRNRRMLDTRNCLDHQRWEKAGFKVCRLGDGSAPSSGGE